MKIKMSVAGFILVALAIMSVTSSAQTVGGGLPIGSQDALREYALAHVDHGSRYVVAPSIDWGAPGSVTYTNATGKSAEEVLDKLFSVEFVYRLINPDDEIQGIVYLYDKDNNLLFYGNAQYFLADLKTGKPQYNVWLQNVPLPLNNVAFAKILALDADGKTAKEYSVDLDSKGHPLFSPWMAGSPNGILVVKFTNGSTLSYDLSNPVGTTPSVSHEVGAYNIQGHYVIDAGTCPPGFTCTGLLKIIAVWDRPTVLYRKTGTTQVTVDVLGVVQENGQITFERPTAMDITAESGATKTVELPAGIPTIALPEGNLRLKFHWHRFALPNTLYTGLDGGVGKGDDGDAKGRPSN